MSNQKESRPGANGAASLQQNKPDNSSISDEKSKVAASQFSVLEKALALAEQGLLVFPCSASKAPTCPGGFKVASNKPDEVRRVWTQYPAPLVGVATGAVSEIDALDIDPPHGGDKWLAEHTAKIPATRTHQTRSGGLHLVFQHHTGLRNSSSRIAPGVDIRADGGYLIWWPAAGLPVLNDAPPAPWPDWLLALALPPPPPPRAAMLPVNYGNVGDAYARAALRRAIEAVANAQIGTRNSTLNRGCWTLLLFVAPGLLDVQTVADALAAAALSAGLSHPEVVATLASSLRARGIA